MFVFFSFFQDEINIFLLLILHLLDFLKSLFLFPIGLLELFLKYFFLSIVELQFTIIFIINIFFLFLFSLEQLN